MATSKFIRGTTSKINSKAIKDGQILLDYEGDTLCFDINSATRKSYNLGGSDSSGGSAPDFDNWNVQGTVKSVSCISNIITETIKNSATSSTIGQRVTTFLSDGTVTIVTTFYNSVIGDLTIAATTNKTTVNINNNLYEEVYT